MAGLREKQKAKRNRAIVEAASTLFKQSGYEAARIEAIAEVAEVSVGTLYNYFGSKADLLLAIVSMEVEEVLHQGETVLGTGFESAAEAICQLVSTYYDHSLVYLTKEMWRTAMALSIQGPDTPFSRRYRTLDAALSNQVVALVSRLKDEGLLRADVDAKILGEIIFLSLNALFAEFTVNDDMTLEELNDTLASYVGALTQAGAERAAGVQAQAISHS